MFGSSQGSGLFGNKPAGSGLFGGSSTTTSTFGSTTTGAGGGGLFGKPAGSTFGASTGTGGGSLFGGGSATTATSFGTSTAGGGLFGGASTAASGGGGLFGKPATTTFGGASGGGGSLFGGSSSMFGSATNAPSGTTIKFNPPIGPDTMIKNGLTQNIQTKNFCITAMKEYEGKSFEELRVDDYIANRKAPAAGTSTTAGGFFGNSTSTTGGGGGGLFGGAATQQKSLFGSSTTTSSPFGSSAATGGTSLFGGAGNNNPQTSGGLFGSKPAGGGGLFGSPAATGTTSTFGSTTAAAGGGGGLFGKPAAATSSPFGATTGTSTFGQPAQPATGGGLFGGAATGTATNTSFGTTTATGGGLFGSQPQAGGGLFGQKPAAATTGFGGFGATSQPAATTTGGLFGNAQAKPGGLFGSTTTAATGGGLFGSQPAQQSGGLFGGTQQPQQSGGLFGSTAQQPAGNLVVQNPATVAVAAQPIILGSDVNETRLKMAMIEANLATNPYGDSPLLKIASPIDTDDKPNPISVQRQMRFLKKAAESGVSSPASAAGTPLVGKSNFLSANVPVAGSKVRSRSIAVNGDLYKSTRTPPTLGKGIGGKPTGGNNTTLNSSFNGSFNKSIDPHIERALSNNSNTLPGSAKKVSIKQLDLDDEIREAVKNNRKSILKVPRDADELPVTEVEVESSINSSLNSDPREAAAHRRAEVQRQPPVQIDLNMTAETNASVRVSPTSSPAAAAARTEETLAPAGITLKTSEYYCEPSLRAMSGMIVNGEVVLPDGLTIGRATYGNIYWPGPLKLKNIALDEVVNFRHKEVTVYADEENKPPVGEELNRPAEVTLERVWKVLKETKEEVRDPIKLADLGWRDTLERVTLQMDATFKDYRPSTGSWVFKVQHFSKYGLADDDDDEPAGTVPKKPLTELEKQQLKERSLHSRVQRSAIVNADTYMSEENEEEEEDDDEVPEELEMDDIIYVSGGGTRAVPGLVRGLGGDLNASCDMDTTPYEYEAELMEIVVAPPAEKKPKLEESLLLADDNKLLVEKLRQQQLQTQRMQPQLKCHPAARHFEGGLSSRQQRVGFNLSKFMDLASARGAVGRVGWSSKGVMAASLQPESNAVLLHAVNRRGSIQQDYVTDMLEHNIRFSQTIQRNHSISAKVRHHEVEGQQVAARIKPTTDHAQLIDSFCATAAQSSRRDDERVWKLAKALFPGNTREGQWRWERLDKICDWLREEVADMPQLKISGRGSSVWQALCRGQLEEAVTAADKEDLLYLSTLLTAFQVDPRATQQDLLSQLDFWKKMQMLEHIDVHILKIHLLMAGKLSTSFPAAEKTVTVSCIDGLPWKQAMGVYLWYLRGFRCFEETLDVAVRHVPAPKSSDDLLFCHLLKLSRDQAYSVEMVLDAAVNFSSSPFDVHLSWHLWTVLRSLGFNTMEPASEQRLHTSYAEQLMANSLPHLALFVLSHISSDQSRSVIMRECLDRFALSATPSDYARILETVNLPSAWIAAAKYIKAKTNGQTSTACEMAIRAGDYVRAFDLFVMGVAPNAVVSDDLDELQRLVNMFEPVADNIPQWGQKGQIYADYVDFKTLSRDNDEDDDLRVAELISSLSARLQAPVFDSPIQRLCAQNIGLEMFEVQKLLTGTLAFQMPFDMANLTRELTGSVTTAFLSQP